MATGCTNIFPIKNLLIHFSQANARSPQLFPKWFRATAKILYKRRLRRSPAWNRSVTAQLLIASLTELRNLIIFQSICESFPRETTQHLRTFCLRRERRNTNNYLPSPSTPTSDFIKLLSRTLPKHRNNCIPSCSSCKRVCDSQATGRNLFCFKSFKAWRL